jgi:hypothetical protein
MERWMGRANTTGRVTSIGMKASTKITFEMEKEFITLTKLYIRMAFGEEAFLFPKKNDLIDLYWLDWLIYTIR